MNFPAKDEAVHPLRFACNRCHDQKLRCPRSQDSSSKSVLKKPCYRCQRAGKACIIGPIGKIGRPSKGHKKRSSTAPSQSSPFNTSPSTISTPLSLELLPDQPIQNTSQPSLISPLQPSMAFTPYSYFQPSLDIGLYDFSFTTIGESKSPQDCFDGDFQGISFGMDLQMEMMGNYDFIDQFTIAGSGDGHQRLCDLVQNQG
ncbi:hypothetical protein V8C42DRAFT_335749 [Trichoderma barbatum]